MKKRLIAIAVLLSIAGYVLPFVVSQAGAESTTLALAPSTPNLIPSSAPALTTISMRITAYASVPEETDDTPFITANGTYVRDGIVATNLLPFGTEIMIPDLFGNKVFIVEDRMAPQFKKTIDIWMPTVGKALYFGVHTAEVVIIPPSPSIAVASK